MTIPTKNKRAPTYESQQFAGRVVEVDGERKIIFSAPALYRHFLKTTCNLNDEITLNITNKRAKRSDRQNRYYRLYLSLIAHSSGHSPEDLHTWVKGKFLTKGITEVFGDKVRNVGSTTKLSIGEFCELLCQIEEATGIPLPKTEEFLKPLSWEQYAELKDEQKKAYSRMKTLIVLPVNKI